MSFAVEKPAPTAWVVSDGRPGHENQSLALAESVGAGIRLLRIGAPGLRLLLPLRLWPRPLALVEGASLAPPWPDLVVGCGRRTAPLVAAIRRRAGGSCRAVQILRNSLPQGAFDLTIHPLHDGPPAPGRLAIVAALHRITPARLAEAARAAPPGRDEGPDVALLIGGPGPADAARIAAIGLDLARRHGARLLVACSRRTGPGARAILRGRLAHAPHLFHESGEPNPYLAFLARADHVLVTGDSISMTAEAVASGKPVQVIPLARTRARIARCLGELVRRGAIQPYGGELARFRPEPLDDMARAEAAVRALLAGA